MNHRVLLLLLLAPSPASALPIYALASAHTCGNCHVSPTYEDPAGWTDPAIPERKCNLSCTSCHVNPSGGGLRNTSGRYFGQSSLALIPLQERSYSDLDRELLPPEIVRAMRSLLGAEPEERPRSQPSQAASQPSQPSSQPSQPSSQPSQASSQPSQPSSQPSEAERETRTIPSSWSDVQQGIGEGQNGGWSTFGHPLLGPSEYAYWDGRYGDLIADPVLALGGDFRMAYWTGSGSFFPMQLDLHAGLHPLEHVTLLATLAGRGRAAGPSAFIGQERTPVFFRNAFLMLHELPYMSYAKAGVFMPAFGTNIDDHTSFVRRYFDMDVSTSDDTVVGVEVGFAANYPYANLSAFRGITGGTGGAINLGWRALGWSASAHAMIKRRELDVGGNLEAAGVAFGFTPSYWLDSVQLSLLGELSVGRRRDQVTGRELVYYTYYSELGWSIFNGVNVRLKHDFAQRDADRANEREQRLSLALDLAVIPGLTLMPQARLLFPPQGEAAKTDLFLQMHVWF